MENAGIFRNYIRIKSRSPGMNNLKMFVTRLQRGSLTTKNEEVGCFETSVYS